MPPLLGAHVSAAGSARLGLDRAVELEAECLQIFTRSPGTWRCRTLPDSEVQEFRERRVALGSPIVLAHDIYLTNLAAPPGPVRDQSISTLVEERRRCDALGLSGLVCHMGAHLGDGYGAGLTRFTYGLLEVLQQTADCRVPLLLETSAGQGSCLGSRFEDIGQVIENIGSPPDVGVCVDTCHIFAAGYDIAGEDGYERTWDAFERHIGFHHLRALHVNDSKRECGSRVDRHEHIGAGHMGRAAFARLVQDPRMDGRPMILETPEHKTMHAVNLNVLRGLRDRLTA